MSVLNEYTSPNSHLCIVVLNWKNSVVHARLLSTVVQDLYVVGLDSSVEEEYREVFVCSLLQQLAIGKTLDDAVSMAAFRIRDRQRAVADSVGNDSPLALPVQWVFNETANHGSVVWHSQRLNDGTL